MLSQILELNSTADINQLIAPLNTNQLADLDGKLYGHLYWIEKGVFKNCSRKNVERAKHAKQLVEQRIASNEAPFEKSQNGTKMFRSTTSLEMFEYARLHLKGFELFISRDHCLGYFINKSSLKVVSYCEGDIVTYSCDSEQQYQQELLDISNWYQEEY